MITGRVSPKPVPHYDKMLVFGARRSGKTAFLADDLIRRIVKNPEDRYVYMCNTWDTWDGFKQLLYSLARKRKNSEKLIGYINDRVVCSRYDEEIPDDLDVVYTEKPGVISDVGSLLEHLQTIAIAAISFLLTLDKSFYSDQGFISEVRSMGWHLVMLRDNPRSVVHKYPEAGSSTGTLVPGMLNVSSEVDYIHRSAMKSLFLGDARQGLSM